jgi:chaperone modulatory protein CbpM
MCVPVARARTAVQSKRHFLNVERSATGRAWRDRLDERGVMIVFEDLVPRLHGLDRQDLLRWIENRWVLPERRGTTWIFHEVDVARVELILEIRHEFTIDEEALPLVLGLLDQVYDLRRQLRRICDALAAQPADVQAAVRRALPPLSGSDAPQD